MTDKWLNINYTYYNNYDLFMEVVEHYKPYEKYFNFTVIDDGSQDEPLTSENLPENWKGYRVEQDLGWGNEVCRNILMRKTNFMWNALLDMDIVIDFNDDKCKKMLIDGDFLKFYGPMFNIPLTFQFFRGARTFYENLKEDPSRKHQCLNSFIISKEAFNKTYGYDMTLAWIYGSDYTLPLQMAGECLAVDTRLKKIAVQASPGSERFAPKDSAAYDELFKIVHRNRVKGFVDANGIWINKEEYIKNCKDYPEVVDL